MEKPVYLLFALVPAFAACKKEYTCQCTNPGGTTVIFMVKDTKKNAQEKCFDYYDANFGDIPFNETMCGIK